MDFNLHPNPMIGGHPSANWLCRQYIFENTSNRAGCYSAPTTDRTATGPFRPRAQYGVPLDEEQLDRCRKIHICISSLWWFFAQGTTHHDWDYKVLLLSWPLKLLSPESWFHRPLKSNREQKVVYPFDQGHAGSRTWMYLYAKTDVVYRNFCF